MGARTIPFPLHLRQGAARISQYRSNLLAYTLSFKEVVLVIGSRSWEPSTPPPIIGNELLSESYRNVSGDTFERGDGGIARLDLMWWRAGWQKSWTVLKRCQSSGSLQRNRGGIA